MKPIMHKSFESTSSEFENVFVKSIRLLYEHVHLFKTWHCNGHGLDWELDSHVVINCYCNVGGVWKALPGYNNVGLL